MGFHDNLIQTFQNFKNVFIGSTDISDIGDGTLSGAIDELNDAKQDVLTPTDGISIANGNISSKVDGNTITFNAQGQMVASTGASSLNDLTNVDISSPTNNQVLKYNSTLQEWENQDAESGGHVIIDSNDTELTQRESMKFNSPFLVTDDSTNEVTDIALNQLAVGEVEDVITPLPSRPVASKSIEDLEDTNISNKANKQVLQYNSTTQKWENSANITLNGNAVNLTLSLSGDVLTITTT